MQQLKTTPTLGVFLFLLLATPLFTQSAWERSVLVSTTIEESVPAIHFHWPADPTANGYQVFKKAIDDEDWGQPIALLAGTANSFSDSSVVAGEIFDYAFFKKNFGPVVNGF